MDINFCFQTKKLVIHLIDDFHVMNVLTKPTDKANAAIHQFKSPSHSSCPSS